MDDIWVKAIESLDAFGDPKKRTFILYLFSAFILSLGVYLFSRNRAMIERTADEKKSIANFFKYLFPKDVYLHNSAKQDYVYFIINGFIHYGIVAAYILSTPFFVFAFAGLLSSILGPLDGALSSPTTFQLAILTLVYALMYDFGAFITHYFMHKIPILWVFHKVHHSAERLTPMTLYRMHPVDIFLTGIVISICSGLGVGSLMYFWNVEVTFLQLLGLNAIFFVFYVFGYNLRHSHIWLNYPKWLSHIFVSPAQHQIHHSIEKKHWDKNMGLIFAFWDLAFKTLYVPKKDEAKFEYGVRKSEPNPYHSVPSMFILPFIEAWEIFAKGLTPSRAILNFILIAGVVGYSYFIIWNVNSTITARNNIPATVHLEDLTWSETAIAINKGYDRIIIPTGGTEQNGRHMILGKHNYVVKLASERAAKTLGKTLVAPVVSYVPEEIHMSYPGTVSISEDTFASILEDSAESFKRHGFKYIFFLGDSSHNQAPQQEVADKLNMRWFGEGAIVAHISDYYSKNRQIEWLENEGYSPREIGGHAGIRDTSELLLANPKGVRKFPITPTGFEGGDANGEHDEASKNYGDKMIQLKVDAAVNQIQNVLSGE